MTYEEIFTEARKQWGGNGSGSRPEKTAAISVALPELLEDLGVKTLLDLGCGDVSFQTCLFPVLDRYIGADVVGDVIARNQDRFPFCQFVHLVDGPKSALPAAELVLCRDVLAHLSFSDAQALFAQIQCCGAEWLLATDYWGGNADIQTGKWRPLSLTEPPFSLPGPLRILDDSDGKRLALWNLKHL
jgi:hypothetical protein